MCRAANILRNRILEKLAMKLTNLTKSQHDRVLDAAEADAKHWLAEAKDGTLPRVELMHLDWHIDDDMRDAGIDDQAMQQLSFEIARRIIGE